MSIMEMIFEFIKDFGTQLSAIGAALAFIFAAYKFQSERRATQFWKEFEAYHKLIKELVQPPEENGAMYIDRQTAAMYELRIYKRYWPHSLRMLEGLKLKWDSVSDQYPRLIEELDLTIEFIRKKL